MRDLFEIRELTIASRVQNLAGLFLPGRVEPVAGVLGEVAQSPARDLRVEHQRLDGRDERVAAEGRREPGNTCHRKQAAVELFEQDAKIHLAAAQEAAVEEGVIGADPGCLLVPSAVTGFEGSHGGNVETTE